jgi:hypothetical protein
MNPLWPHGDPRDVVRAIVADPRFTLGATLRRPAQASWLDLLRDWLGGLVHRLLHGIDRALGANVSFERAIGFALLAAALALAGWGTYRLTRSYARGARVRTPPLEPVRGGGAEPDSAALRAAARAAAHAGRYREAAGLLFSSVLRALDERGRIAYDPARTPGEYRRLVRDPLFDALAGDAVVAVFAAAEPTAELFEGLHGKCERFLAAFPP